MFKKTFCLVSTLLCFNAFSAETNDIQNVIPIIGTIVAVSDGDTLTLLDSNNAQHKIRLAFIDAPEKKQAFGEVAKQSLAGLGFAKQAKAHCPNRDRYGRNVCEVIVDGKSVNTQQVERGMAWVYAAYAPKNSPLVLLQEKAKVGKVGLWVDANPTPPWDFRRK